MKTWVVANQKGGVGKTTVAVTLAGWLVERGESVLLVDMDPQCSLSAYLGFEPEKVTASVYDLFTHPDHDPADVIVSTRIRGIDLMPAIPAMATLDRQLGQRSGQGLVLGRALNHLRDRYAYALVDCSPSLGVLMVNALGAADRVLIPTQTEYMALRGLERMLRTLAMVNHSRASRLPFHIIATMFDKSARSSIGALNDLRKQHGDELWQDVIPMDTQFREASRNGLPLPQHLPQSRGAMAFKQLLDDVMAAESARQDEEAA